MVAGHALVVGGVAFFFLQVGVDDGDNVVTVGVQVGNHFLEMGKVFPVDDKGAVAVEVIDVQVEDVDGNAFLPEGAGYLSHPGLGIITVTTLLVTERPQGRQGGAPDQRGVVFQHFFRMRPVEEVVVEFTAAGTEGVNVAELFTEVEAAPMGVVEVNPVRHSLAKGQKEGNRLI